MGTGEVVDVPTVMFAVHMGWGTGWAALCRHIWRRVLCPRELELVGGLKLRPMGDLGWVVSRGNTEEEERQMEREGGGGRGLTAYVLYLDFRFPLS